MTESVYVCRRGHTHFISQACWAGLSLCHHGVAALISRNPHTHTCTYRHFYTQPELHLTHTHTLTQSLTDTHIIHILHTHLHPGQQCADCSLCTAIVLQRDLGRGCELSIRGHFTMNAKAVQFINSMPFVKLTRNWVKIVSK